MSNVIKMIHNEFDESYRDSVGIVSDRTLSENLSDFLEVLEDDIDMIDHKSEDLTVVKLKLEFLERISQLVNIVLNCADSSN